MIGDVSVEDDTIVFTVGEDEYTVSAEGDEEILEACGRKFKKSGVAASTRRPMPKRPARKAPVASSTKVIRKMPTTRRK